MDEEITIIDSKTRNEKIKNFFIKNSKKFIVIIIIIFLIIAGYLFYEKAKEKKRIKLANQYDLSLINFKAENKKKTINELIGIINKKDTTYSPLALYFLIDNNLIEDTKEVNILFNKLIDETNLQSEIKNLIIYKKALFNSEFVSESELLKILNPIINSESIWKSHALYLVAEYFYSKNEKQKAKEFFNQILMLTNSNNDIKLKSQKRISRDYSE